MKCNVVNVFATIAFFSLLAAPVRCQPKDVSAFTRYLPNETRMFYHLRIADLQKQTKLPLRMRETFREMTRFVPQPVRDDIATTTFVEIRKNSVASLLFFAGMHAPIEVGEPDIEKKSDKTKGPDECGNTAAAFANGGKYVYLPFPIILVTTSKPYNKQAVLRNLPLLDGRKGFDGIKMPVKFLDKHTLAIGRSAKLLETVKENVASPFASLLKGQQNQTIAIGAHIPKSDAADLRKGMDESAGRNHRFRAVFGVIRPIAAMTDGTGVFTAGDNLHLVAGASYKSGASAQRASMAMKDAVVLFRIVMIGELLEGTAGRLSRTYNSEEMQVGYYMMRLLQRAQRALRSVDVSVIKSEVQLRASDEMSLVAIAEQVAAIKKKLDSNSKYLAARRIAAARLESQNNLKQLGLAIHNFASANQNQLPPAAVLDKKTGKPLLSWRVTILPYIEQENLYRRFKFDEPWDSPHNKRLLKEMPAVYAPTVKTKYKYHTFYRVFTGRGTAFWNLPTRFGPYYARTRYNIGNIPDGNSNTWMVVEAGESVPWTKPTGIPFDPKKPLPKLGGMFKDGFHVLFGDGSAQSFRKNLPDRIIRLFIQADDGNVIPDVEPYRWPMLLPPPLPDLDE